MNKKLFLFFGILIFLMFFFPEITKGQGNCWGTGSPLSCDPSCLYSSATSSTYYYDPGCWPSPCPTLNAYLGSGSCIDNSPPCYELTGPFGFSLFTGCTPSAAPCAGESCSGGCSCTGKSQTLCQKCPECFYLAGGCTGACDCSIISPSNCSSCGCTYISAQYLSTNLTGGPITGYLNKTACTWIPAPFDFSISPLSPISGTVVRGNSISTTVTATLVSGASQTVTFSASGFPANTTYSWVATNNCSPTCSRFLVITTSLTTPAGTYPITITVTGGGVTRTATYTLIVELLDFSISVPSSVLVAQGWYADTSIAINLIAGTSQLVALSASAPAGKGISFTWPEGNSCWPTCYQWLRISTTSTTSPGTYTITITGVGGGLSRTATFPLNVQVFDFSLSVDPSRGFWPLGGGFGFTNLYATLISGPSSKVSFSGSAPSGISISFQPSSSCYPSCNEQAVFEVAASVPAGTYPITITGTAGTGLTRTTTYTLIKVSDFILSVSPNWIEVIRGTSGSTTMTATLVGTGSSTPVWFSVVSGLPSGASASFIPSSCNPTCSSTMIISTDESTPVGSYPIYVKGTNGIDNKTVTVYLSVYHFDFTLTANPNSGTIGEGYPAISTEIWAFKTADSTGSTPVSLSVSGLPAGASYQFLRSGGAITPDGYEDLLITDLVDVPPGTYTIIITGSGGGKTRQTTYTLTKVITGFDFDLSVSPSPTSLTIIQGQSGSATVTATVTKGTPSEPVTFGYIGLPTGVSLSYNPASCWPNCSSTWTFNVALTTQPGIYPLTIYGNCSGMYKSIPFTLQVSNDFDISLSQTSGTTVQGGSVGPIGVTLKKTTPGPSLSTSFMLGWVMMPPLKSWRFDSSEGDCHGCCPTGFDTCSSNLTMTSWEEARLGTFSIEVCGDNRMISRCKPYSLTVTYDYEIQVIPSSYEVCEGVGGSTTATVNVIYKGQAYPANSPVNLSISSPNPKITVSPTSFSCTPPCSLYPLTITVDPTTPVGTYPITITGKNGDEWPGKGPAVFTVYVNAFDFSLSLSSSAGTVNRGDLISTTANTNLISCPVETVSFSIDPATPLPSGVTANFIPSTPCTPSCLRTLTFITTPNAQLGTFPIRIRGISSSSGKVRSKDYSLTIIADFNISAVPPSATVQFGNPSSTPTTINLTPVGGALGAPVTLIATLPSSPPTGLSAKFSNGTNTYTCTPPCSPILAVATTSVTSVGTYRITITGTGGGVTKPTYFDLTVTAPGDFSISLSRNSASVEQGQPVSPPPSSVVTATLTTPPASPVTLSTSVLPNGVGVTFSPLGSTPCTPTLAPSPCQWYMDITTSIPATPVGGPYSIGITGTAGAISHTATFSLTVTAPPVPPTAAIHCLIEDCKGPGCECDGTWVTYNPVSKGVRYTIINDSYDPDPGGIITSSDWSLVGPASYDYCDDPTGKSNCTIQNIVPGEYTITLTVKDGDGLQDTTSPQQITIKQDIFADFECSLDDPIPGPQTWGPCTNLNPVVGNIVYFQDTSTPSGCPSECETITSRIWQKDTDPLPFATDVTNPSLVITGTTIGLTVTDSIGRTDSQSYDLSAALPLPKWKEIKPF
jgi:hypothetical protein